MIESPKLKALVAFVVAVLVGAVAQGLINGAAALWVTLVVGALTTAGVWAAPNTKRKPAKKAAKKKAPSR